MIDRRHERVDLALEVEFGTAGAFLVAYSTNLSKGGMFVETDTPLPVGTELTLHFSVPGEPPIDVRGIVAWVQAWSTTEHRKGMGIRFEQLEARHGDAIDRIVAGFRGLRLVVMAHDPAARANLARAVRTVLGSAEIIEAATGDAAEAALARDPDLVLVALDVDLDDDVAGDPSTSHPGAASDGLLLLRLCHARARPTPVVALAGTDERRALAAELGADAVLASLAPVAEIQATIVRLLARPAAIKG